MLGGSMVDRKLRLEDLAVFGGAPAFRDQLYVGRPNIGDRAELSRRIDEMLDGRRLTNNGPHVQEFERRIADTVGVEHCVATCNATVALEILVRALGLSGEVIVPSMTFIATAHALHWQHVTPVFCDIDPLTHNLDARQAEASITPRTTGIIGVHLWGRACDVGALADVAGRHGLKLVFDAAHAFGCSHEGEMIGGFGDAEVFSFHATKFLNSFEGGAIVTDDEGLATSLRLMINFGFAGYDEVISAGTNGKMTEVSAAMGLTSLDSMDEFVQVNRRNYERYEAMLANISGIRLTLYDEAERNNFQYIALEIDEAEAGVSRDEIMEVLWSENVIARRYFYPGCHLMEPYRSLYPDAGARLPHTERLASRLLSLPTGTAIDLDDIPVICSIIELVVARSSRFRQLFADRDMNVTAAAVIA